MSLREKLKAKKEEKVQAKEQAQLQEASSQQEQEQAALKEELSTLVRNREALAEIKAAAAEAGARVRTTKAKLKAERANLRDLHQMSKDEETGETELPKPAELIRTEDLQDEEEIQSYHQAREDFRLSAAKAKEVQAQLVQLGVTGSESMLPGQLEAVLEEREKELDEEARTFVSEHPDVDPEMTARIREELISSRANEITKELNVWRVSNAHTAFHRSLADGSKSGRDSDGRIRTVTLHPSLGVAVRSLFDSPQEKQAYMKALAKVYKDGESASTDLEREAIGRSIARQIVVGPTGAYSFNEDALTDAVDREVRVDARRMGGAEDLAKDPAKMSREDLTTRTLAYAQESRQVKDAVIELSNAYRKYAEYQAGPRRIAEYQERISAIDKRLEASLSYTREGTIAHKERKLDEAGRRHETEAERITRRIATHKEVPANMLAVAQLPAGVLDAPLTITRSFGQLRASVDGVWHLDEMRTLLEDNEKDTDTMNELQLRVQKIKNGKNGMFGPSKEKKADMDSLALRMKELFGDEEGGTVEAAEAKIKTLETTIQGREEERQELIRKDDDLAKRLAPIDKYADLLGDETYSGTVSSFIDTLRGKVSAEIPELEAEKARVAEAQSQSAARKTELATEKRDLAGERQALLEQKRRAEETMRPLKDELERTGYIAARR